MLNEEEKTRIVLEEQYRNEVKKKFKSKIDLVETIIKILQGLAIIVGIWATYYAYQKQSKENKQREIEQQQQTAREFRKSFYEKKQSDEIKEDLKQISLQLAHAASKYTITVWLDSTERKNYNR